METTKRIYSFQRLGVGIEELAGGAQRNFRTVKILCIIPKDKYIPL